jgi:hypothetical protein
MPKNNEIAGMAKHSSRTSTSAHETRIQGAAKGQPKTPKRITRLLRNPKNLFTFAASGQDKSNLAGCGIFISTCIDCRIYGLPTPNGFCTARSEIVLVDRGIAQPFFLRTI